MENEAFPSHFLLKIVLSIVAFIFTTQIFLSSFQKLHVFHVFSEPQNVSPVDLFLVRSTSRKVQISNARRKLGERSAWLSPAHTEHTAYRTLSLKDAPGWLLFSTVLPCDGTFEKQPRVDVQRDGGKWICGLQEEAERASAEFQKRGSYSPECIVYSFGSNNDFTFENRVHKIAPHCIVHTFDPTSSAPQAGSNAASFVHFHGTLGLGSASEAATQSRSFPLATIREFMKKLGHTYLTVLKIDAEGVEWGIMIDTDWEALRIAQVSFELHPQFGGGPRTVGEAEPYFTRLEEAGYFLASIEPVTPHNHGQVEVVFLHEDFYPGEPWN